MTVETVGSNKININKKYCFIKRISLKNLQLYFAYKDKNDISTFVKIRLTKEKYWYLNM